MVAAVVSVLERFRRASGRGCRGLGEDRRPGRGLTRCEGRNWGDEDVASGMSSEPVVRAVE